MGYHLRYSKWEMDHSMATPWWFISKLSFSMPITCVIGSVERTLRFMSLELQIAAYHSQCVMTRPSSMIFLDYVTVT